MEELDDNDKIWVLRKRTWLSLHLMVWNLIRVPYLYLIWIYAFAYKKKVEFYVVAGYEGLMTLLPLFLFHIFYARRYSLILIPQIMSLLSIGSAIFFLYFQISDKYEIEETEIGWTDPRFYELYCHLNKYLIGLFFLLGIATPCALIIWLFSNINMFEKIRVRDIERRENLLVTYDKIYKPTSQQSGTLKSDNVKDKLSLKSTIKRDTEAMQVDPEAQNIKFERKNNISEYWHVQI